MAQCGRQPTAQACPDSARPHCQRPAVGRPGSFRAGLHHRRGRQRHPGAAEHEVRIEGPRALLGVPGVHVGARRADSRAGGQAFQAHAFGVLHGSGAVRGADEPLGPRRRDYRGHGPLQCRAEPALLRGHHEAACGPEAVPAGTRYVRPPEGGRSRALGGDVQLPDRLCRRGRGAESRGGVLQDPVVDHDAVHPGVHDGAARAREEAGLGRLARGLPGDAGARGEAGQSGPELRPRDGRVRRPGRGGGRARRRGPARKARHPRRRVLQHGDQGLHAARGCGGRPRGARADGLQGRGPKLDHLQHRDGRRRQGRQGGGGVGAAGQHAPRGPGPRQVHLLHLGQELRQGRVQGVRPRGPRPACGGGGQLRPWPHLLALRLRAGGGVS
mmetsp:Transcript_2341/g.6398  ORF Transcript_2341/g.6398 Transcript_2341/m.6398 type:complete len:385 (+) Transcript_2341:380-1534(+)